MVHTSGTDVRLVSSKEYGVTSVSGTTFLVSDVQDELREPRDGEASVILANDCKPSEGEWELCPPLVLGPNSGIWREIGIGRLAGTWENVADVGENASVAERFEPRRAVGEGKSAIAVGTWLAG